MSEHKDQAGNVPFALGYEILDSRAPNWASVLMDHMWRIHGGFAFDFFSPIGTPAHEAHLLGQITLEPERRFTTEELRSFLERSS